MAWRIAAVVIFLLMVAGAARGDTPAPQPVCHESAVVPSSATSGIGSAIVCWQP